MVSLDDLGGQNLSWPSLHFMLKLVLGNIGGGDRVDDSVTEDDKAAEVVPDSDTDLLAKQVINSEIVCV
jgi:hypothetical protein